jgi:uncharacterized membrane protein YhhN
VNAATVVLFVVAAVFALGDWIARARHQRVLEFVCKPAALAALVAAAVVLDPAADARTRRVWFVVALLASLKGDILLMLGDHRAPTLEDDRRADDESPAARGPDFFVLGLAAFLVGHLCYIGGFWTRGPRVAVFAVVMAVVVVALAPLALRILRALRSEPVLRPPVALYIAVIAVMLASALASANPWAAVGAVLFVGSDAMIAWDRFVARRPWAAVAIMVTYHLGQAALVVSLLH